MNYIIFNWPDLAYIETSWQLLGAEVQILTSEYFFHLFSGVQQENGLLSGFYTLSEGELWANSCALESS